MDRRPWIVNGKWFVPAVFLGFVAFTLGMSFLTLYLGKNMRPTLERMQIEKKQAEMEKEAQSRRSAEAKP